MDVPKLLEAIAGLLWPSIAIVVLFKFSPTVSALIDSARLRKFTPKVGGQELSMDELSEQQRALIADLQDEWAFFSKRRSCAHGTRLGYAEPKD